MVISLEPQDSESTEVPRLNMGTILIAEDDMNLLDSIGDMLKIFGYDSILTKSGEELIERFNENKDRILLVLADIAMPPGITGIEAAKRIRESGSEVPIILSSAAHENHDLESLIRESVITGSLPKPYEVEVFEKLLQSILGSAPTIEP